MGQLLYLPAYLLFVSAMLKVFVFPATEPTRYGARLLVGMTALQALTLATLGAAWIRWAVPALHEAGVDRYRPRRRQVVGGVGVIILLVMIAGLRVFQLPTLEELTHSVDVTVATDIIDNDVETLHRGWDALTAGNKDALCDAGKAIRSTMHAYNSTPADLNHAERAIYDITEPRGRCR